MASTPVPNLLYGYDRLNAFTAAQQTQLISIGTEMVASNDPPGLLYPFLAVQFKGDDDKMWAATNQCLGGSVSSVKVAEHLNRELERCTSGDVRPVSSAAFSIAMNGSEARLYISWKHDELDYYMTYVRGFLLQDPEHFIEFRKHVRSIVDWGNGRRLKEIRDSLDSLLDESGERVDVDGTVAWAEQEG